VTRPEPDQAIKNHAPIVITDKHAAVNIVRKYDMDDWPLFKSGLEELLTAARFLADLADKGCA